MIAIAEVPPSSCGIVIADQQPIYWKISPLPGGRKKYQLMSFGGKNMKRRREKGG
jgi:hypothetical protein